MVHEDLYRYRPGGFHPANLGDTFHGGPYVIRHKLGYGGFSTAWLARDVQEQCVFTSFHLAIVPLMNSNRRWVSIKIKTAQASTEMPDNDSEVKVAFDLEHRYTSSPQGASL